MAPRVTITGHVWIVDNCTVLYSECLNIEGFCQNTFIRANSNTLKEQDTPSNTHNVIN